MVLDQQALVEDLLERPPDGLDVRRVHRPVGLVEVDPVPHAGGQLGEGVGVAGHRLAALGVELGDAVRLDVLLAGEAQLLLDGELDREAVAVPAGLAGDVVALHRPVAREDVLEDAGLDVVGAGHAVGGRRALVEDPLGAALGLLQAALEDLVVLPEGEDLVFEGGEVHLCGDGVVGGHRGRLPPADAGTGSSGGTRRTSRPAVPPSLAAVLRSRPSCLGLLPGLVGHRGGCSSGGSGVIFPPCTPPGSHRPRVAGGCVRRYSSHLRLAGPVYRPGQTVCPRGFGGAGPGCGPGRSAGAIRRGRGGHKSVSARGVAVGAAAWVGSS